MLIFTWIQTEDFVEARKHGKQVGNKEELFLELYDEIKVIRVDRELMPHNLSNG